MENFTRDLNLEESLFVLHAHYQKTFFNDNKIKIDGDPNLIGLREQPYLFEVFQRILLMYAGENSTSTRRSLKERDTMIRFIELGIQFWYLAENPEKFEPGATKRRHKIWNYLQIQQFDAQDRRYYDHLYRYYRIYTDNIFAPYYSKEGFDVNEYFQNVIPICLHFSQNLSLACELESNIPNVDKKTIKNTLKDTKTNNELSRILREENRTNPHEQFFLKTDKSLGNPIFKLSSSDKDLWICPISHQAFRFFIQGLYYRFIECSDERGKALENYLVHLVEEKLTFLASSRVFETEKPYIYQTKFETPDLVIINDQDAYFFECKNLKQRLKSAYDIDIYAKDISKMANAIIQIYERINDYLLGKFPKDFGAYKKQNIYPIITTLEPWTISKEEFNEHLEKKIEDKKIKELMKKYPYILCSIENIEQLSILTDSEEKLNAILQKKISNDYSNYSMTGFLQENYKEEMKNQYIWRNELEREFPLYFSGK